MHHILNVKRISTENKFIECDHYFLKSLTRVGSLVAEPKYGFFGTSVMASVTARQNPQWKKWRLFILRQWMAYLDYQKYCNLCRCITLILYARFKALGSFLHVFDERLLGILTLRTIGKCTSRHFVAHSGCFGIIFRWVFLSRLRHEPTSL